MTAGPALVWEGRFQPFHRGHVAYVGELLARAPAVTVVVVANELSRGHSPVPEFSRLVDVHHAAERNPWPLGLRHRMVAETLRAEFPVAVDDGRIQVLAGHRLDLDWDLYRQQLLPPDRAFAVPLRDEFEDAKAAAWARLGERVVRVDVSHLPAVSGSLVRELLAAGEDLDRVLLPATRRLLDAYRSAGSAETRTAPAVQASTGREPVRRGADRPVVALLTPLGGAHRAALDRVAEVASASDVAELPEPVRRRCRVVVLRSGPSLAKAELDMLPALTDVVRSGNGVDNIDLPQLTARGITLHRRPDAAADAVAELALTGLAALCRRMGQGFRWMLEGAYAKHLLVGEPVADQTLVVWGAGPVGRAVVRQARRHGLRASFIAHPSVPAPLPTLSRQQAMCTATAHVLAVPLRDSTQGLVDSAWLAEAAPRRPYLVNMGRHELLRLDPVERALRSGTLRGCYLDPVDERDLPELSGFLDRTRDCNVLLTQHQGAQRRDVRAALDSWSVDATVRILDS